MDKLGFVLALAALAGASAWALAGSAKDDRERARPFEVARTAIALSSLGFAWAVLRFAPAGLAQSSGRARWAFAGFALGMATACIAGVVRARWTPARHATSDGATRLGGASAIAAIALASAGLIVSSAVAVRLAGLPAVPIAVAAFAFGAAVAALAFAGGGDVFVVAAAFGAATTSTATAVAVRNDALLRGEGLDPLALVALPVALLAFGAHATTIGVMAVKSDDGDAADAPRLRGFLVAASVASASAAAAAQWWGRPPGHGGWLSLAALAGGVAAFVALLVGRYYDDPEHRPRRALARAAADGGSARPWTAAAIGLEGGVALVAVAGLVAFAASRCGELLGLEGGGALAIAIAGAAVVACSAFLAALSAAEGAAHGALAHDVVALSLASGLVVHGMAKEGGSWGDVLVGVAFGALMIGAFLALQMRGVQRAAAVVLALPVLHAVLRGRHGLSLSTWVATAVGLLVATIFERAAWTYEGEGPNRAALLRGVAGSLPTLVAGAAACAATAAEVLA